MFHRPSLGEEGGNTSIDHGETSFSPLEIEEPRVSLDNTADIDGDYDESELINPLVGNGNLEKSPSDPNFADAGGGDHHGAGPPGSAGTPQVVVNIIISFVGAGLLAVPNAFSQSGWLLGTVTLLIVSALNVYAMLCLPQVQKILQKRYPTETLQSYGDLGRVILGECTV